MVTLDSYVRDHLKDPSQRINVLLSDAVGWDFEVLLRGKETLKRTDYLEFSYGWKGAWGRRAKLGTMEHVLDFLEPLGFVCYWAGDQKLWRISKCWLPHYESKYWSSVACVSVKNAPAGLIQTMESTFQATIRRHS